MFGDKLIENRTWFTDYRGPLLIHAGKSREWLGSQRPGELPSLPDVERLDFGCIIGRVTLYDVCRVGQVAGQRYAEGPYCWRFRDRRPLPSPIPWRGQQGLFDVPWPIPRDTQGLFAGVGS
jgi:hypothetical protein